MHGAVLDTSGREMHTTGEVREVAQGYECGISLGRFNDIKEGDILEAYTKEEYREE